MPNIARDAAPRSLTRQAGRRARTCCATWPPTRSVCSTRSTSTRAHVVGASMGGMIAQTLALDAPSAGALADVDHVDDRQPRPAAAAPRGHGGPAHAAAARSRGRDRARRRDVFRTIGSPGFPFDEAEIRRLARAAPSTAASIPTGTARQLAAILASGNRVERLRGAARADARHPRHRRSAGSVRRRPGHRQLDPRRHPARDRGHGPRHAPPGLAAHDRRHLRVGRRRARTSSHRALRPDHRHVERHRPRHRRRDGAPRLDDDRDDARSGARRPAARGGGARPGSRSASSSRHSTSPTRRRCPMQCRASWRAAAGTSMRWCTMPASPSAARSRICPTRELRRVMETNFFGVLALTRALLPTFRAQQRGRIVVVSSNSAFAGEPANSIYVASKWAIEGWAESLVYEVERFGIDVVLVEPGPYRPRSGRARRASCPRAAPTRPGCASSRSRSTRR